MKALSAAWKTDKLWGAVLVSWYVTVFSSFFGSCLLRIPLPVGGNFFLFRGVLPLTVLLFAVWCVRNKRNPFAGLTRIEQCFLMLVAVMVLYGTVSVLFAISKGAWFSKYLTMGYYLCFTLLFMLLCKDHGIRRATLLLACGTMLFCTLGGLAETRLDCFFETPYAGRFSYYFMGKYWQAPIFTFYNTNGFSSSNLWMLLIGWMFLFESWSKLSGKRQKAGLWGLTVLTCLGMFLYSVSNSRLTIYALLILFAGLAVWLFLRYKRGLWTLAAFVCCFLLIYAGEHYDQIKADITYVIESIEASKAPAEPPAETPGESPDAPADSRPSKPERPVVSPNNHGTMNELVPVDSETGKVSISGDESGGIRVNLLKNSLQMLIGSKGLGIGLGNAELRMKAYDNTGGITNVHCFIMEVFLEFGIFAILPLLLLACVLLWNWFLRLRRAGREGDRVLLANTLFQIIAVLTYPLLSTVNSSSWGLSAMWLFLGYVLLDNADRQRSKSAEPVCLHSI